ncbi:hypothetical protein JQ557_03150 [Bradyrhizobium sp. U87765 SZCCT0131]|nr:hypothetical protein [Bradyrhizobium sp. U87765 SZCCT0131]MBR1259273.1 hypothetical protein [Bradyrhizobium sp. U87765 SZCCT0134]MBR1305414.1 hypothetical protein [Bradyrhizobium sp. U87765 SZCCT0110]MBR1321200.1 hypothetical protein [Bradyrhizobium sp. U87765 SZCCT0109]MBR1350146.1 hypothetical protein [Bradyrhizobium sp. U87765 SZCCT0048]
MLIIALMAVSICGARPATAAQGPGLSPGTASPLTQQAMAIVVYGSAAALVAAGLIGAARRR